MPKANGKIQVIDKVVRVPVSKLKKNPWNPNRLGAFEMRSLEHGMKSEGFIDPIHAQKGTNIIIDGEHRWKAAKKLKMRVVPVIYLAVDDTTARKLTLALINRKGTAQEDGVALLLHDIQEMEDISLSQMELDTAISRKVLKDLLASVDSSEDGVAARISGKAKKKNKKDKKNAKINAKPSTPDGAFNESDVGDNDLDETHQYPITFFAPDMDARALIRALCFEKEAGEYSFARLRKIIDYYLKKHPKKAKKVKAAIASAE